MELFGAAIVLLGLLALILSSVILIISIIKNQKSKLVSGLILLTSIILMALGAGIMSIDSPTGKQQAKEELLIDEVVANEEINDYKAEGIANAETYPAEPGAMLYDKTEKKFTGMNYHFKGELIKIEKVEGLGGKMMDALLVKNERGYVMPIFPPYETVLNQGDEIEAWGPLSGDGYASSDIGVDNVVGMTGAMNASEIEVNQNKTETSTTGKDVEKEYYQKEVAPIVDRMTKEFDTKWGTHWKNPFERASRGEADENEVRQNLELLNESYYGLRENLENFEPSSLSNKNKELFEKYKVGFEAALTSRIFVAGNIIDAIDNGTLTENVINNSVSIVENSDEDVLDAVLNITEIKANLNLLDE